MEEDIKILENAIRCNKKQFEELGVHIILQDDEIQAIENLINRVKELEEAIKEGKIVEIGDSIPKSKIREIIEELNKELTQDITRNDGFAEYREYAIDVLQELLEDK